MIVNYTNYNPTNNGKSGNDKHYCIKINCSTVNTMNNGLE